jgi:steroid delta-isomerase-like uncharacterized protein
MKSLIESYYQTFNSGDREALLALLDEQVVHEINEGVTETGRDAFRSFLQRMDTCYRETVEDLAVFSNPDQPHRAAAEFMIRGTYVATDEGLPPASGQPYHIRVGAFFEASNGRVTRVTNYYNLHHWLAVIGA